ncbi:hypothetical protein CHARACLAT_021636 [Characodon lateralis]|uniref:Uncharacterized protein n=1 Tax=Characodon lateralis TaxID=208331 RepID=A0ABU7ED08_9TELE|nr:hypothetical protein [Characodon lateralis]
MGHSNHTICPVLHAKPLHSAPGKNAITRNAHQTCHTRASRTPILNRLIECKRMDKERLAVVQRLSWMLDILLMLTHVLFLCLSHIITFLFVIVEHFEEESMERGWCYYALPVEDSLGINNRQ